MLNAYQILVSVILFTSLTVQAGQLNCRETEQTGITNRDCRVLQSLYIYTDGDRWLNNENWMSDQPVSTWHGVEVKNDRVSSLKLRSNNMRGTITLGLGLLDGLEVLDLADNQLRGRIDTILATLVNLKILDLSHNNFHGTIPASIANLKQLEILNIAYNQFTGDFPTQIIQLSQLRSVEIVNNNFSFAQNPKAYAQHSEKIFKEANHNDLYLFNKDPQAFSLSPSEIAELLE